MSNFLFMMLILLPTNGLPMLPILSKRIPFVELIIIHSLVQGEFAPRSIERAILIAEQAKNRDASPVDLIILSRGGGSNEDLSAFNDEIVVRAIVNCSIPILTAIGHEIDASLSDLVSDDFPLHLPQPLKKYVQIGMCF